MEHKREKELIPPQESKKDTFEGASAEFFTKRMQEVETSHIDELLHFPKKFLKKLGEDYRTNMMLMR